MAGYRAFMQGFCFLENEKEKHSSICNRVVRLYTVSVCDTDIGATSLQLYVRGCYSDTMVMSVHPNDASVGCLRS